MKATRKIISILLAVAMLIGVTAGLSAVPAAAEEVYFHTYPETGTRGTEFVKDTSPAPTFVHENNAVSLQWGTEDNLEFCQYFSYFDHATTDAALAHGTTLKTSITYESGSAEYLYLSYVITFLIPSTADGNWNSKELLKKQKITKGVPYELTIDTTTIDSTYFSSLMINIENSESWYRNAKVTFSPIVVETAETEGGEATTAAETTTEAPVIDAYELADVSVKANWESGQYDTNGALAASAGRIRLNKLVKIDSSKIYKFDTGNTDSTIQFVLREYKADGSFLASKGAIKQPAMPVYPTSPEAAYYSITMFDSDDDKADLLSLINDGTLAPTVTEMEYVPTTGPIATDIERGETFYEFTANKAGVIKSEGWYAPNWTTGTTTTPSYSNGALTLSTGNDAVYDKTFYNQINITANSIPNATDDVYVDVTNNLDINVKFKVVTLGGYVPLDSDDVQPVVPAKSTVTIYLGKITNADGARSGSFNFLIMNAGTNPTPGEDQFTVSPLYYAAKEEETTEAPTTEATTEAVVIDAFEPADVSVKENWELGQYSYSTGLKDSHASRIRVSKLVKVTPTMMYKFDTANTDSQIKFVLREYDATGKFIANPGAIDASKPVYLSSDETAYISITIYKDGDDTADLISLLESGELAPTVTEMELVPTTSPIATGIVRGETFYEFTANKAGEIKSEGWYAPNWTTGTTTTPSYADGALTLSTGNDAVYDKTFYNQINVNVTGIPNATSDVYVDVTNNLDIPVKFKVVALGGYTPLGSDDLQPVVPAKSTATIYLGKITNEDGARSGNFNFLVMNAGTNPAPGENQFTISSLYYAEGAGEDVTTEETTAEETTAEETTAEETTAEDTHNIVRDPSVPALDVDSFNLQVGTVTGAPGTTVEVPVTLNNNPGIWSVKFTLQYDNSWLTLTSTRPGDVFTQAEILTSPLTNELFTFTAQNSTFDNNTKNGTLVYLTFEISADATDYDSNVVFCNYDPADVINADADDVAVTYGDGVITISTAEETTAAGEETTAAGEETTAAEDETTTAAAGEEDTTAAGEDDTDPTEGEDDITATTATTEEQNPSTGSTAAPIAAMALAAAAAFVIFKSKKD